MNKGLHLKLSVSILCIIALLTGLNSFVFSAVFSFGIEPAPLFKIRYFSVLKEIADRIANKFQVRYIFTTIR